MPVINLLPLQIHTVKFGVLWLFLLCSRHDVKSIVSRGRWRDAEGGRRFASTIQVLLLFNPLPTPPNAATKDPVTAPLGSSSTRWITSHRVPAAFPGMIPSESCGCLSWLPSLGLPALQRGVFCLPILAMVFYTSLPRSGVFFLSSGCDLAVAWSNPENFCAISASGRDIPPVSILVWGKRTSRGL